MAERCPFHCLVSGCGAVVIRTDPRDSLLCAAHGGQRWAPTPAAATDSPRRDDAHYAQLAVQPIEVTEAWAKDWPPGIAYHLGEAVAMIARCGTRGQAARDLRKAAWLLRRAADVVEGKAGDPRE